MPNKGDIKEYNSKSSGNHYNPGDLINGIVLKAIYRQYDGNQWKTRGKFICPYCGKEFDALVDGIKRSTTKSCGCLHKKIVHETKCIDMTNKICGYVKVLYYVGKNNRNHAVWHCVCLRCGTEFDTTGHDLRKGNVKSCGCLFKENRENLGKAKFIDRTGNIVNGIEFIEYLGNSMWLCKCHCGKLFKCDANNITSGHTTSCGCRTQSLGSEKCEQLLTEKFGGKGFAKEKWFTDCRDKLPLPFDFYITSHNIDFIIEYDGEQHFHPRSDGRFGGEDAYQITKLHDEIKNDYCIKNNIPLIRIPYTLPISSITIEDLLPETSPYLINK